VNVTEAMKKAADKTKLARQAYNAKQKQRPASVSGILQFMQDKMDAPMAPINKENRNKINGLIKFLRNNGFSDLEIYDFIEKCIEKWPIFMNIEMFTDNRKKYNLDTRPNILDIINCKTQLFNEINTKIDENDDEEDLLALWGKQ
jgi:hypothetical protein